MATNEVELKLIVDTAQFQQGLKAVAGSAANTQKAIETAFKGLDLKIDSAQAAKAFDAVNRAAKETVDEQKSALAALIASGQKGSAEYKKLQAELLDSAKAANKLDSAVREVDSQLEKTGKTGSNFGSIFAGISLGGLAAQGLSTVFSGVGEAIKGAADFQQGLAGLSAITGVTGTGLDDLGQRARDLALKFGGDANTQISAFSGILSKFGAQLADSPEQLGILSDNINTLAKAGGLDAAGAMSAVADSMLQFGVNVADADVAAAESSRFINVLAKSAQVGAAEIPQVAEAVLQAGVAAKGANLSFEQTNAAIQVLAAGGKVGSEAGIALRNVLGLLQKQSGEGEKALKSIGLTTAELGQTLTTQGLDAALKKLSGGINTLGSDYEKNALKATLFGSENASAAGILLNGADTITDWTAQVTGSSAAVEQAAINMNTLGERVERLKSQVQDGFITAFQGLAPILANVLDSIIPRVVDAFKNIFTALAPTLEVVGTIFGGAVLIAVEVFTAVLQKIGEGLQLIAPILPVIVAGVAAYAIATNAAAIGAALASAAQAVLNAVMSANPIGAVVVGIVAAVAAYAALADVLEFSAEEQLAEAEATKKSIQAQLDNNKAKQDSVRATQGLVAEFKELANKTDLTAKEQKRLQEIQEQLDRQYPDLIDQTKSFADNLAGVEQIGKATVSTLQGLTNEGRQLADQLRIAEGAIAAAKRNVALTELRDVLNTGDFVNNLRAVGDSSGAAFRKAFGKNLAGFEGVLFNAKTTEQIDRAQAQLLEFVNTNQAALGDQEKQLELYAKIDAAVASAKAALKAYGIVQGEVSDTTVAAPEVAAPATKVDAVAKKSAEDLLALAKEQIETRKKQYENELQAQKEIETQIALNNGLSDISDSQKRKLLSLEIQQKEALRSYGEELLKVTRNSEGLVNLGIALPKENTEKVRQDVIGFVLSLTKDLQSSQLAALKLGIDKTDLGKQVDEALSNFKEIVKSSGKAAVALEIPLEDFVRDSNTAIQRVRDLQPLVEAAIADAQAAGDTKRETELAKRLDNIKKSLIDLTAETEKITLEAQDKLTARNLALIEDAVEREYQTRLQGLNKDRAKQLEQAGLTAQQKLLIQKRYEDSLTKLNDEFYKKRNADLFEFGEQLQAVIAEAFQTPEIDTQALADLDNEEAAQLASLKRREGNYEEYTDNLGKIDEERRALAEAANISLEERLLTAFTKLSAPLSAQTDKMLESFQKQAETGVIAYDTIGAAAALSFTSIIASGENAKVAILKSLIEIAQKAIAIYTPQIIAAFTSLLGPFGIPAAFAAIGLVNGLLGAASAGFREGGYTGDIPANAIAGSVHGKEFVFNEELTRKYRPLFDHIHAGKDPARFASQDLQSTDMAAVVDGLARVEKVTKKLAARFESHSNVAVSGELRADGNSIAAMIQTNRSNQYSRG